MGLHLSYGRNLGFPLSCDGYLREPLELHKGSQASFQVSRGNSGLHSRLCRVIRPHVVLRRECLFFFFSSCKGKLGVPLELRWGPQRTCHVASEMSGLPSIGKGHLGIPLTLLQGNRTSSRVEVGNSVFLSICNRDLGVPVKFQHGSHALSRIEAWNSAFLSIYKRGVRPPVELRRGTPAFSRGATQESDLPSCCGILSIPSASLQGNQALS